jgi:sugar phosphate isomerase/epimerase
MYKALGPGAIGIQGMPLPEAVRLARDSGFAGLVFDIREAAGLAANHGVDHVRSLFVDADVRPASWSVPGASPREPIAPVDLEALPGYVDLAQALDCPRATTFLPPGSNAHPYQENFAWAVERLRPFAAALAEGGCWLGLEFCGPKTYRREFRYEFIYTIAGVLELGAAIGTGNIGVLLDAFHLYTGGGTNDDIDLLSVDQIVMVHVNDAVAGVDRDEQQDLVRMPPVTTGVIDIAGFMAKLSRAGYTGPVMSEPFHKPLSDLAKTDPVAAARETSRSLDELFRLTGIH